MRNRKLLSCAGLALSMLFAVQPLAALPVNAEGESMALRLELEQTELTAESLAEADAVIRGALYIDNYSGICSMRIAVSSDEGITVENGGFSDPCYLEGRDEERNVYNPYSEVHDVSNLVAWYGPNAADGVSYADTPVADANASFIEFDVRVPQGTAAGEYDIYLDQRSLTLSSGKLFPLFKLHAEAGEYGEDLPAVEAIGCTITVTGESVVEGMLGDVNCDGKVNTADAVRVLGFYNACHIMGNDVEEDYKEKLDAVNPDVAYAVSDVNDDKIRDTADAVLILQYYTRRDIMNEDITWEDLLSKE